MNRVLKNIKKLIVYFILSIICILIICKCSSIVNPFSYLSILNKPIVGTSKYEWLKILESFAFAYLTSFMFYLIVDFIPKCKREHISFKLIEKDLISLYMYMDTIVNYLKYKLNFNDIKGLSNECIKEIDDFYFTSKSEYLVIMSYRDYIKDGEFTHLFNARKECISKARSIINSLENVFSSIALNRIDDNLVILLNEIRNSNLIRILTKLTPTEINVDGFEVQSRYNAFYESLDRFVYLHDKLEKYKFLKLGKSFRKANKQEIAEYTKHQKETRLKFSDVFKYFDIINNK